MALGVLEVQKPQSSQIQFVIKLWLLEFESVCLEARVRHSFEVRQGAPGNWKGDQKTPLEVKRGGEQDGWQGGHQ